MDFYFEADKRRAELVRDLQELVRIPSLYDKTTVTENAPFGKEVRNALDWVLNKGKQDGFITKDVDGYAGIVEFGKGEEIMGVLGHLDIVPVGVGWSKDPFGAEIEDGYLYGRGSGDDKGPTIAAYYAMKILKDLGVEMNKRVYLITGCDEESGMACMHYYQDHAPIPNFGFVPDASFPVIYGEKGIMNLRLSSDVTTVIKKLIAGERPNIVIGQADATVDAELKQEMFEFYLSTHNLKGTASQSSDGAVYSIEGIFSHGSLPQNGINSAWHLLNFIGSAYNDEFAHTTAVLLNDYRGKELGVKVHGSHMGDLTVNIGIVNISDSHASIVLDLRYPQETDAETIQKQILAALEKSGSPLKMELIQNKDPLFVNPKSELVSTLENIYRKHTGDMITPLLTMGGGTYARTLPNCVAFGCEFPLRPAKEGVGDAHQKDEGIEIESLILATAIYAEAIFELTR